MFQFEGERDIICTRDLRATIYKEFSFLNNKGKQLNFKVPKHLVSHFSKEDVYADMYKKGRWVSLLRTEMQAKTTFALTGTVIVNTRK